MAPKSKSKSSKPNHGRPPNDYIAAVGIASTLGYEHEVNQVIGLCKDARSNERLLSAITMPTYLYRTQNKMRIMFPVITWTEPWFTKLFSVSDPAFLATMETKNGENLYHLLADMFFYDAERKRMKRVGLEHSIELARLHDEFPEEFEAEMDNCGPYVDYIDYCYQCWNTYMDDEFDREENYYQYKWPEYLSKSSDSYRTHIVKIIKLLRTTPLDINAIITKFNTPKANVHKLCNRRGGYTPLMLALACGTDTVYDELLNAPAGLDLNVQSFEDNFTALHPAIRLGLKGLPVVEKLCALPATNLTLVDKKGNNPFMLAIDHEKFEYSYSNLK